MEFPKNLSDKSIVAADVFRTAFVGWSLYSADILFGIKSVHQEEPTKVCSLIPEHFFKIFSTYLLGYKYIGQHFTNYCSKSCRHFQLRKYRFYR